MACSSVDFTDVESSAVISFPNVSRLENDQLFFEPGISSEDCFEDIVGKSPSLRRVLEHVAIVAPTDSTVL